MLSLFTVLAALSVAFALTIPQSVFEEKEYRVFVKWAIDHDREYIKDSDEGKIEVLLEKYTYFKNNLGLVDFLNSKESGQDLASFELNEFADYDLGSHDELIAALRKSAQVERSEDLEESVLDSGYPTKFDWRDHGAVGAVRNQERAGTCFAFSSVENVEAQNVIHKVVKKYTALSVQQVVECDLTDCGTQGGLPRNVFNYVKSAGGLATEESYPYCSDGLSNACRVCYPISHIEKCHLPDYNNDCTQKCHDTKVKKVAHIDGYVKLPKNETTMRNVLHDHGPLTVGINANLLQFYRGGIIKKNFIFCNPQGLDHGVLVVGYGISGSTKYWIIKNSWGSSWGIKGYFYFEASYDTTSNDDTCGVDEDATQSYIGKPPSFDV